jgi:hypothetical protein
MRKFIAVLLIVVGGLFALSDLLLGIETILRVLVNWSSDAYNIGFNVGQLFFVILFGFISYWLIKKGIQLVKSSPIKES